VAKTQNQKLWVIVASSILFYISFRQIQYFPVILAMILVNYWIGKLLLESQIIEYKEIQDRLGEDYFSKWLPRGKKQRQQVLIGGILFNIFLLILAKYIPFLLNIFAPINPSEI